MCPCPHTKIMLIHTSSRIGDPPYMANQCNVGSNEHQAGQTIMYAPCVGCITLTIQILVAGGQSEGSISTCRPCWYIILFHVCLNNGRGLFKQNLKFGDRVAFHFHNHRQIRIDLIYKKKKKKMIAKAIQNQSRMCKSNRLLGATQKMLSVIQASITINKRITLLLASRNP